MGVALVLYAACNLANSVHSVVHACERNWLISRLSGESIDLLLRVKGQPEIFR